MIKLLKKDKGITLIALIVTIIVLLILAGITITQISGQDGLLEKAVDASEKSEQRAELEGIKLAVVGAVANGEYEYVDAENLKNGLNGIVEDTGRLAIRSDNAPWIVVGKTGIKYKIKQNGEVTSAEPVATVQFDSTIANIAVGKTKRLPITCRGASGEITEAKEVIFTSENINIATVQEDGSIKIASNATVGTTAMITIVADGVVGSNKCVVTVIESPKPQRDEYIILGEAIDGIGDKIGEEANQDDWRILCQKDNNTYAILADLLPNNSEILTRIGLVAGNNVNDNTVYGVKDPLTLSFDKNRDRAWLYPISVSGDSEEIAIEKNRAAEIWKTLIYTDISSIPGVNVVGAINSWNLYSTGGARYLPNCIRNKTSNCTGYWVAVDGRGHPHYFQYLGWNSSTEETIIGNGAIYFGRAGLCPVVILPSSVQLEKNEKDIWEVIK